MLTYLQMTNSVALGTSPILQIGQCYLVSDLLGRGGMGQVWQAVDQFTDKQVAIKRIRPSDHAAIEAWTAWEQRRTEAVHYRMQLYEVQISQTLATHGPRNQQRNHRFRARALFLASQSMWHVRQLDEERAEEESDVRYQNWLHEEGSNTRTAAHNVPTKRAQR